VAESSVVLPPETGAAVVEFNRVIADNPDRSKCSAQMKIMRVTPTDKGLEDRTFECRNAATLIRGFS
jgi:hypothetical protein